MRLRLILDIVHPPSHQFPSLQREDIIISAHSSLEEQMPFINVQSSIVSTDESGNAKGPLPRRWVKEEQVVGTIAQVCTEGHQWSPVA